MRRVACLVVLGFATAALAACSDAGDTSGSSLAARRAHSSGVPAPGSDEQHDPADTAGETQQDPGNPNANTPPPAPADQGNTTTDQMALTLGSNTPAVDLGKSVDIDVTVEPKSNVAGGADLTVSGLPADAKATFNPAHVDLGAAAKSKLTITVPFTAIPSAPNTSTPIVITAKSAAGSATANANFKVNPKMTLTVPLNIDALRAAVGTRYIDQWGTPFGSTETALQTQLGNGIVVTVFNSDSKPHIIHGANGFAHGDTSNPIDPMSFEMLNGAPRLRTLNVGANTNGYLHEGSNGPSVSFRIKVDQVQQ